MSEFDLIARYFTRPVRHSALTLGVGDDCALLQPRAGHELAISTDMLVEGRHFFSDADANALGHKSLAVNLSDLAAMGAEPLAFTLALALPSIDENWLSAFSKGLFALADQHNIALIGGDTTKGPLTMSITVFGDIPTGQALRRSQAKVGDDIWVSGALGDARLALSAMQGKLVLETHAFNQAAVHLHRPTPRIALGMALRDVAHAAIDISDGLLGDLQHVLKQSNVGATLQADDLPLGEILKSTQTTTVCHEFALNGGDDYELCFTAPTTKREAVHQAATKANTVVTRIGQITAAREINILNAAGEALAISSNSYDHFKT